jgi:hypothetical protein
MWNICQEFLIFGPGVAYRLSTDGGVLQFEGDHMVSSATPDFCMGKK